MHYTSDTGMIMTELTQPYDGLHSEPKQWEE